MILLVLQSLFDRIINRHDGGIRRDGCVHITSAEKRLIFSVSLKSYHMSSNVLEQVNCELTIHWTLLRCWVDASKLNQNIVSGPYDLRWQEGGTSF
jgi:hypothetical protein